MALSERDDGPSQLSEAIVDVLQQLQHYNNNIDSGLPSARPLLSTSLQPRRSEGQVAGTHLEWNRLCKSLHENPVDADGWLRLIELTEQFGNVETTKEVLERLRTIYPHNPYTQTAYLQHYHTDSRFGNPESLFDSTFHWTAADRVRSSDHFTTIRDTHSQPLSCDVMRNCYAFAAKTAGHDKDSYEIWHGYIEFLKSCEAHTTWDLQQKTNTLRSVYQEAVQIPMIGVDRIWNDYISFENYTNAATADWYTSEVLEEHMHARNVLYELLEHLKDLIPPLSQNRSHLPSQYLRSPHMWLPRPPSFNRSEHDLVAQWRHYLIWETTDPLHLRQNDPNVLESRGEFAEADVRFMTLLQALRQQLESCVKQSIHPACSTRLQPQEQHETQVPDDANLSDRKKEYTTVWIAYMRFAQRTGGLGSAWDIFAKACQDVWATWEMQGPYSRASSTHLHPRMLGSYGSAGQNMYINTVMTAVHDLEKQMAEVYRNEPPIKRCADRYRYGNINPIATRDLGFVLGTRSAAPSTTAGPAQQTGRPTTSRKHALCQEHGHRSEHSADDSPMLKRPRTSSTRSRDNTHTLEQQDRHTCSRPEQAHQRLTQLPAVITEFMRRIPTPYDFTGPVFAPDDLMQLIRNTVIPPLHIPTTSKPVHVPTFDPRRAKATGPSK
ncbi:hypothetical protein K466DRAFT_570444 [Polyporus arcularius HHB13444]|uniref:mRNA 3'-end-processing protein RNA14 n=1 Tax=Polyporus arcularius HHB13444 TaxID=1314778 RepID=A0A5C3NSV1_9APHY|nr:hypothetical protein K466DRAFT_570444 [Polyporus arcularius HHB13444]